MDNIQVTDPAAEQLVEATGLRVSGRMYVLEVDDGEAWLEPLRRVCATPDGRNALKALLKQRQPESKGL